MQFNKDTAVDHAVSDLSKRLSISEAVIRIIDVSEREFPDMSLGAPEKSEMAAMMISPGWEILLSAGGKNYEYRADSYQLRLYNFHGRNYVVET